MKVCLDCDFCCSDLSLTCICPNCFTDLKEFKSYKAEERYNKRKRKEAIK